MRIKRGWEAEGERLIFLSSHSKLNFNDKMVLQYNTVKAEENIKKTLSESKFDY